MGSKNTRNAIHYFKEKAQTWIQNLIWNINQSIFPKLTKSLSDRKGVGSTLTVSLAVKIPFYLQLPYKLPPGPLQGHWLQIIFDLILYQRFSTIWARDHVRFVAFFPMSTKVSFFIFAPSYVYQY